jgi:hypothetical protein
VAALTAAPTTAATAAPTATPAPGVPTATPSPTTAGATATPTPPPRPTSTPLPTATPFPEGDLQPGPVAKVVLRLLSARKDDVFREPPFEDASGNTVAYYQEILIFDVTPLNAANKPCEAEGEPEWSLEGNSGNVPYLTDLGNSNPFLLRVNASGRTGTSGRVKVTAALDGKTSNALYVVVK